MRKGVLSFVLLCAFFFVSGLSVSADTGISADEQRILDALNTGISVGGKTFYLDQKDVTQAENHLKQNDLTTSEVNQTVDSINQAKALIAAQTIDVSNINSLSDLIKALPADIKNQIRGLITSAANVLGLTISLDGVDSYSITTKQGNTAFATGSPVKNTGTTYGYSLIVLVGLILTAIGAFVIGRKAQLA